MSIYKTPKSPFWQYDFQLDGHRFPGSTKETDRGRALKVVERKRREAALLIDQGKADGKARRKPMRLQDATSRYFEEKVEGSPRWKETDRQLETLLDQLGDDTWLHDLDTDRIARMVAARSREVKKSGRGKGVDPVSPATVNRETQLLRRILRRAALVWKPRLPEDDIHWAELMLEEPEGRTRELAPSEETTLIPALREELTAPLRFSLITGLRQTAVLSLTWPQVDFRERTVTIRLKSRKPGGRVLTVPLTDEAIVILANVRADDPVHVFTYECRRGRGQRQKGKRYPFSRSGWRKEWRQALDDAGIENFVWHDLRHTAATRTLRASNLAVVQKMLGHKSVVSTMRYAHASIDDVRQAMTATQARAEAASPENPRNADHGKPNPLKKLA